MINRGKTASYSYVFLLILTVLSAMFWYYGLPERSSQFIAPSALLGKAGALSIAIDGKKVIVVKDESPLWGFKAEAPPSKSVVTDPDFRGIRRTSDTISESLQSHEPAPVEELISYLTEKPFLRKVDGADLNGTRYEITFLSKNAKICNFFVGPLSFTGAEVYIRDISSGNTYLVDRGLYFLVERIYSGG